MSASWCGLAAGLHATRAPNSNDGTNGKNSTSPPHKAYQVDGPDALADETRQQRLERRKGKDPEFNRLSVDAKHELQTRDDATNKIRMGPHTNTQQADGRHAGKAKLDVLTSARLR
jgi:hypothetical protein